MVERFFRDITEERIRRRVFRSVDELKLAIQKKNTELHEPLFLH